MAQGRRPIRGSRPHCGSIRCSTTGTARDSALLAAGYAAGAQVDERAIDRGAPLRR